MEESQYQLSEGQQNLNHCISTNLTHPSANTTEDIKVNNKALTFIMSISESSDLLLLRELDLEKSILATLEHVHFVQNLDRN